MLNYNDVSDLCVRIQDFYANNPSNLSFEEQDELRIIIEHWLKENTVSYIREM